MIFKKTYFTCISLLLLNFYLPVSAQSDSTVTGLRQLLDHVNAKSSFLVSDSAAILIRLAQQDAERYNWLPSFKFNLQADLGTNNNMPGGYFSYGVVPGNSRVRNEGNSSTILTDLATAAFDWTVYDFGENKAKQKVAASDLQVERSKFQQSKYQLEALAIDNYLQWLRIEDLLSIQLLHIERNKEIRQSILALAKSGVKAGVDTSIAEAEISKSRLNYLELKGQREQYKLMLSAIANIPTEQLQADTGYINKLIGHNLSEIPGDTLAAQHPLLTYYRSLYNNSLENEHLVKKSYFPTISLQGAVWGRGSSVSASDEFRALSKGIGLERGNYLVGVGITYDLFDIKTHQAFTNYADKQFQEQQMLLSLSKSKLDAQLATAKERLQEIPHQLAAAQAAYRQKLALYKNGLTDILELNSTLSILYRAETDYIMAKYIYCKTLFEKAITGNQVQTLLNSIN
jgi:adhesin transport system outer membrane protein